jgi:4a-hydroxytetrahydrobiopterin dehydratase
MSALADRQCVPCRRAVPPLRGGQLRSFSDQLPEWQVIEEHHITRTFLFPDFKQGLDFVNQIGALAEEQSHHPDLLLAWGKVGVTIYTHKIQGLTESDFILGAKIERLYLARAGNRRDLRVD